MHFQNSPGVHAPGTPLGINSTPKAWQSGPLAQYPPIIARFPPVKNLSYTPAIHAFYLAGSRYFHVLWYICFEIIAFRLMCTVLVSFSVKCASRNYQSLKGEISKSQWSITVGFEPSYGDVCNQVPRRDQIWKRLSRKLKNRFTGMVKLHCKCDYCSPVCIFGTRFFFQLTQW